jgi:hypothetical protein
VTARAWHRRLGWIAAIVALAWAATGFLHPVMTWTAPRPAIQEPPTRAAPSADLIAPGPALQAQGLTSATLVRLMPTERGPVWFALGAGGTRIAVDARTGAAAPSAERARAIAVARHYAALPEAKVIAVRRLDDFSMRYPSVNRILPVWEVRLAERDGLTVYVDPASDRLVTVSNTTRRTLLLLFQAVHTLSFLEPVEPLRVALVLLLVGTVAATTLVGMGLLLRSKGRGLRAWHRAIAWVAAPLSLGFTGSGLFHLVVNSSLLAPPQPRVETFSVADLSALPRMETGGDIDLVATRGHDGRALWRLAIEDAGLYFDAEGSVLSLDDAARARQIAGADGPVRTVTRFDSAYGFINRRLPVIGVGEGLGHTFVDLREGLVAGRASPGIVGVEGWTFDTIHKWDPVAELIGRRPRDYLTMIAVALIALTALLGLFLQTGRILRRRT